MSQVDHNLTRMEFICEQYGPESEECQMSAEVRESQHAANAFVANVMSFAGVLLVAALIGAFIFVALSRNLKRSA